MSDLEMTSALGLQAGMLVAGLTPEQVREQVGVVGVHAERVAAIVTGAVPPTKHRELADWCWVAATLGGWHCTREHLVDCADGRSGHVDLVASKAGHDVLVEVKTNPRMVTAAVEQLRRYASRWSVPSPEQLIVCPHPPVSMWGEDTVKPITVIGPSEFARLFGDPVLRFLPSRAQEVTA